MMAWNPDSITQEKLHDFRRAAEQAWGDDTRHESTLGHPEPSKGQCYVTSRWLTTHLGGHVGSKGGHYFWVSPDRSHVIDLTGDQFSYKPADLRFNGLKLDEEDEPWEYHPEQKVYRPGPVMFKRADHPLYKGFRVKEFKTEIPRVKLFRERADAALAGTLARTADFGWGGDSHPGQEPQAVERMEHDRPDEFGPQEYKWVYANGKLEISPSDDYDYLANLAGDADNNSRSAPMALGTVSVHDGRATWRASGNLGLSGLAQELQNHSRIAGWVWGGLHGLGTDQKLAHDVWYAFNEDEGHLYLGNTVYDIWEKGDSVGKIEVIGKTATVKNHKPSGDTVEALQEWADDFKLSLNTTLKTPEDIDGYDTYGPRPDYAQGPTDITPPTGTLRCPECGQVFPSFGLYILHRKEEEPRGDELDREDGHFPEMDMDKVLPPHFKDREPRIFPLAKNAHRIDEHTDRIWATGDYIDLGAFIDGDLVGMATITDTGNIEAVTVRRAPERVFGALIYDAGRRFDELTYAGEDPRVLTRLRRMGFLDQKTGPFVKWSKGKEPMDLIDDPVPFIFDVDKDQIQIGSPGGNPNSVVGEFTPGGIVQGVYEPGGVITITNQTDYPWTVRHLVDLWYWSQPHMRVTDVQYKDPMGQIQKLTKTASNVGPHIRQLAAMDPAVWKAYQALEAAGGEVFVVGGAVRDALMGEESNDIDLMVRGLHQDQVNDILKKLPGKVDLTGKSFGVFRYNHKGHEVEIALPRTERSTGDRRVDFDVNVDHTLPIEDDLLRRDFTINSPAVSLKDGRLVDPYGAVDDIKNRVLRTTHPKSFVEDPTRLLRALVMNARYGVQPDERTRSEMEKYGHTIHNESWDNMNGIMDKMLKAKNPASGFRLAQDTGLLKHIVPELASSWDYDSRNPHHAYPLGTHHMHVLEGVQEVTTDPDMRLAAALHDIGKPASRAMKCLRCNHVWHESDGGFVCPKCGSEDTKGTFHGGDGVGHDHALVGADMADPRLTYMNWPVARKKRILDLIRHHMFPAFSSSRGARKFLNRVGPHADDLLTLRQADMYGKGTDEWQNEKTQVDDMRSLVEHARTTNAPTALSSLAINGRDLIAAGIPQGPQIGQTLNSLMQAVINNPELNERDQLLILAQDPEQLRALATGHSNAPTTQAFT